MTLPLEPLDGDPFLDIYPCLLGGEAEGLGQSPVIHLTLIVVPPGSGNLVAEARLVMVNGGGIEPIARLRINLSRGLVLGGQDPTGPVANGLTGEGF